MEEIIFIKEDDEFMNKQEYLAKLTSLNLDPNRYCIISGGVMLMYNLKETTEDIDIKVQPDYFDELSKTISFKKSPKYDYLYEMSDDIEVAVLPFSLSDVEIVDGFPVESLEKQLEWKLANNRAKDQEAIKLIRKYLQSHE